MGRLRLTIAGKLLLGYLPLLLLAGVGASYTMLTLARLNQITGSIVEVDVPLVEAADQLVDHLLAQDSYGRRYLLLRDPALEEVFRQRSDEFRGGLLRVQEIRGADDAWASRIGALHAEYEGLFEAAFALPGEPTPEASRVLRAKQGEILDALRSESAALRRARNQKTLRTSELGRRAFQVTVVLGLLGVALAGIAALILSRGITGALRRLKAATAEIAEGRFDRVPELDSADELGDLARAFSAMSGRLQRMEQMCLDASPLTRLPGGEAIEEEVRRRAEAGEPLAFCLLDLDNFKAYSDKYGYARGSEVIKTLARTLERVVDEVGRPEDFVGHIGGDDFVLLTAADRFQVLCAEVIRRFDAAVPALYSEEDRARGVIHGVDRQGAPATFPLLSLSIAAVTEPSLVHSDPIRIGEAAARLKERAKAAAGSVCVSDRDGVPGEESQGGKA
jgi:GGDEF domain-containing protein